MKRVLLICLLGLFSLFLTGCSNDSMDNIEIMVTNYPNEYIVKSLYEKHATISSIYPDGVDVNTYKISKKQMKEYAKKDLFVYTGLVERERQLAVDLLSINPDLKIIDTSYVLESEYSPEELWLNPSALLMMSQNVRLSLKEYASSNYLKKDVDEAYEALKILLSEADADYRIAFESTNNKTILVANKALKYLEKMGLQVICTDEDATQKTLSDADNLAKAGAINYIFVFRGDSIPENTQNLLNANSAVQIIELHKLNIITDEERSNKKDYIYLIKDNLESIKKELYQ